MAHQWYQTGYSSVENAAAEADRRVLPFRFWLRVNESAPAIFIDDDPCQYNEHEKAGKQGYPEPFTCSAGSGDDACCQKLGESTYVGAYTLVDARKQERDGKNYQFGLTLFVAKLGTLQTLRRKRESLGAFAYQKVDIARDTDKSPKVGNDFTFRDAIKDHDKFFSLVHFKGTSLTKVFDDAEASPAGWNKWSRIFDLEPHKTDKGLIRKVPRFNYLALLEPRRGAELARYLAGAKAPWGGKAFAQKGGGSSGGADTEGSQDF